MKRSIPLILVLLAGQPVLAADAGQPALAADATCQIETEGTRFAVTGTVVAVEATNIPDVGVNDVAEIISIRVDAVETFDAGVGDAPPVGSTISVGQNPGACHQAMKVGDSGVYHLDWVASMGTYSFICACMMPDDTSPSDGGGCATIPNASPSPLLLLLAAPALFGLGARRRQKRA